METDNPGLGDAGKNRSGESLKEYEKLDVLLSNIPKKAQHGLMKTSDLILTSIDANSAFIALGSNVGVTFLFSRTDHSILRLKSTNKDSIITCVRLHKGIDDQIACGTASGVVNIFCIPGVGSMIPNKQIRKFEVAMHNHYITSLEWSTNGMKLYSGDKAGYIVNTEVDFYENTCTSSALLVEPSTEIVQLDYKHKVLLVSTKQRSFIVRLDLKAQITTIGTQERKMTGNFGACFLPGLCKTEDAMLFCARPGCRIWNSDMSGVVRETHIFSSPLSPVVPEIPLLTCGKLQLSSGDFQFGNLKIFREKEIVTWSSYGIVVLDPQNNRVLAHQSRLSGIVGVAIVEDSNEIFVLRRHADARVIRISDKPDVSLTTASLVSESTKTDAGEAEKESAPKNFFMKAFGNFKKSDEIVHSHKPDQDSTKDFPDAVDGSNKAIRLPVPAQREQSISSTTADKELSGSTIAALVRPSAAVLPRTDSDPRGENEAVMFTVPDSRFTHMTSTEEIPGQADGIVFAHKTKKQKKKKLKSGSSSIKSKDEDTTSIKSASSRGSEDAFVVTQTPNNTPANIDSPLNTIRRADEMLKMVNSILQNTSPSSQPEPVLVSESESGHKGFDCSLPEAEMSVLPQETEKTTMTKDNEEKVQEHSSTVISTATQDAKSDTKESEIERERKVADIENVLRKQEGHDAISFYGKTGTNCEKSRGNSNQNVAVTERSPTDSQPAKLAHHNAAELTTESQAEDRLERALSNVESASKNAEKHQEAGANSSSKSDSSRVPFSESADDVFAGIQEIEARDYFNKGVQRQASTDDFYSRFTPPDSPLEESTDLSPKSPTAKEGNRIPSLSQLDFGEKTENVTKHLCVNTWSSFNAPANIYSLCVSDSHIWFTDKSENIHYSTIGGPKGIQWRKATGQANQICVSPSGQIVWRLLRNVVFAGTKINTRYPEGMKWIEAVRDVVNIAVDNSMAWYIKRNGDVFVQRGLSMERPFYKSHKIYCEHELKHILCRHGIVWAITKELRLLVRVGISSEEPEGTDWELDKRERAPFLFSSISIDQEHNGWAIDVGGQIWFCSNVTKNNPHGGGQWWQVPLSGYVLQDDSVLDVIRLFAQKLDPTKLPFLLSNNRGGLITAGSQGVWVSLESKNILHVCRGSMLGYNWMEAQPKHLSPLTAWKSVCASVKDLDWGPVWAQKADGNIYVFGVNDCTAVIEDETQYSCLSVSPKAAWAVTSDGNIKVRTGINRQCPEGIEWVNLDLSQLGDVHILHVSANSLYIWAVESEGLVYQRIGANAPSEANLNPVWLPIDTFTEIVFTQAHVGHLDWMVWAIDNRRLAYTRSGITDNMPIGQEWIHVPGIQAVDLAITNTGVWALTPSGAVFFRAGISKKRVCGNYWKKIPGTFLKISASASDTLWGINVEGQLMKCDLKQIDRYQDKSDPLLQRSASQSSGNNEDVDWEIV